MILLFQILCKIIAIGLQYCYMAAFAWMFVDVLHSYRMLTEIRDINHGSMVFYYVLGYGQYQCVCVTKYIECGPVESYNVNYHSVVARMLVSHTVILFSINWLQHLPWWPS